jgi:NhaP-type Na+/H+ or K+/H+ antiporter
MLSGAAAVYFGCRALSLESVFATLAFGVVLRRRLDEVEPALRASLRRFWWVAEVFLFVNLGYQVDLGKLSNPTLVGLLMGLLALALALRLAAAAILSLKTSLNRDERRYTVVANIPKATVQAVFGAYPLTVFLQRSPGDAGLLEAGNLLLVFAVVAIVTTAPIGAVLLDRLGVRWLTKQASGSATGTRSGALPDTAGSERFKGV